MLIFGDAKRENEVIGEDYSLKRCESQKRRNYFLFFFFPATKRILSNAPCRLLHYLVFSWQYTVFIVFLYCSVLLFVLGPHMPFPSDIDLCKCSFPKVADQESLAVSSDSVICSHGASSTSSSPDEAKRKIDASKAATRKDVLQDANL